MNNLLVRIIFSFMLFFSLAVFPWWLFLLIGIAGAFLFAYYIEFVVLAIFFDLIYGPGAVGALLGSRSMVFSFILSLVAVFVIFLIERLKKNLLVYNG